MRLSRPYSAYAQVYDRIGQSAFGERMASVVLELLTARGVIRGQCSISVAARGRRHWRSLALVWTSPESIALPRCSNARNVMPTSEGLSIRFVEADMGDLQMDTRFDLATCIYDAFNYLTR